MSDAIRDASLFACLYAPPLPGLMRGSKSGAGATVLVHGPTSNANRSATSDHQPTPTDRPPTTHDDSPLLAIAAEFSPRYEWHRADLVSIDVRGLSRLLGTPRAIGAELRREAASRGVCVHVAVAPTRMAALVLALARPGLTVIGPGGVAAALAPIPLAVLAQLPGDLDPAGGSATAAHPRAGEAQSAMAILQRWGLRTLGELAALPAADLSARLGRAGRTWQAIAHGAETRPLVPLQDEERFEGTMTLEWPIEGTEPLSFVLTRLLEPLSTRLERRDRGAAVLHLQLGLVTREVHDCRLELPSPLRDVRALRTLALLDIEAHPPSAAIDRVTVIIEPTPGRILQHALFARPCPTPEQLSTLLARLGALLGQDRVGVAAVADSFRPGAFAMTPFAIEHDAAPSAAASPRPTTHPPATINDPPPRPIAHSPATGLPAALRRCRQPVPARVVTDAACRPQRVSSDRRAFPGGMVVASAGPWRTSGAWWETEGRSQKLEVQRAKADVHRSTGDGSQPGTDVSPKVDGRRAASSGSHAGYGPWSRDEWDVALGDGAVYRIFRDRTTDGWFIDGIID